MTFDQIAGASAVFLDANTLLYAIQNHPTYGVGCTSLLDRIERQEVQGFFTTHVLTDTIHRIMTIEACDRFGWPANGIANRLRRHPAEVQQLALPRRAFDEIQLIGATILAVTAQHLSRAVDISRQDGLLSGDALIVAVMQDNRLIQIASMDADFDRIPGLVRYSPV